MTDIDGRMDRFEERLDTISSDVQALKGDVSDVKGEITRLRVLYEHHDAQIQMIAEVQAHHGRKLDEHGQLLQEIKADLAPLRDLRDYVARIGGNHETRLQALEDHTGIK